MKTRKPEMAIRSTVFICVNPAYLWLKKFGLTGFCGAFKTKREARSISDHRAAGAQPGARGCTRGRVRSPNLFPRSVGNSGRTPRGDSEKRGDALRFFLDEKSHAGNRAGMKPNEVDRNGL